jgi:hypothetical protein
MFLLRAVAVKIKTAVPADFQSGAVLLPISPRNLGEQAFDF